MGKCVVHPLGRVGVKQQEFTVIAYKPYPNGDIWAIDIPAIGFAPSVIRFRNMRMDAPQNRIAIIDYEYMWFFNVSQAAGRGGFDLAGSSEPWANKDYVANNASVGFNVDNCSFGGWIENAPIKIEARE